MVFSVFDLGALEFKGKITNKADALLTVAAGLFLRH
jgi:hypothetical protein